MSEPPRQTHRPVIIKEESAKVIDVTLKIRRCIRCKRFTKQGYRHQCHEKFVCTKCSPERYRCGLCSYRGLLLVSYYKHVERFHNKNGVIFSDIRNQFKLYFCEWCTFKTYSQLMYISHIRRCVYYEPPKVEIKPEPQPQLFKCEQCPFKSKTIAALRHHERNDECRYIPLTDGVFQCKLCLYKSKILQAFRNHVELTHMLKGRFKCEWCDFRAVRVDELTQHMTTHIKNHEITRFKCDLCLFQVGDKAGLRQHVMMNHIAPMNMKRKKCRICKQQELRISYRRRGSVLCGCKPCA